MNKKTIKSLSCLKKMQLITGFQNQYDEIIKNHLASYSYIVQPDLSSQELRTKYYGFLQRLIMPLSRTVLKAFEPAEHPMYETVLNEIISALENGDDLYSRLSTRITDLEYSDPLLNDWGIYHLHLGSNLMTNGFVARTGDLLFLRVDNNYAYLIAVGNHNDWTEKDMLEIVHNSWPQSISQFLIPDAIGVEFNPSSSDINSFRKAGINSAVQLSDGAIYTSPGGGLTSIGTSILVSEATIEINRILEACEDIIRQKQEEVLEKIKGVYTCEDTECALNLVITNEGFYADEPITHTRYKLYSLSNNP